MQLILLFVNALRVNAHLVKLLKFINILLRRIIFRKPACEYNIIKMSDTTDMREIKYSHLLRKILL